MKKCTWVDCPNNATTPQTDKDGKEWANLCDAHAKELEESVAASIPKMMSAWVKAQGGAKKATARMVGA